jgi:hypothetical protein
MSNRTEVHDPSARFAGTSPRLRAGRHGNGVARSQHRHELTTATASISTMKSGPARRVTPTVVLVGVATPI